ncbi:hypothetical protein GW590_05620 [Rahnella sp. SAP-1]|uniref:Homeobox protein YbgS n=1 Tax=Rouxiella aceris TaxID=2703884 RepID=A0A848MH55_9GAMM|nr:protein YbgS [Rouxiella aceris]NMP26342.1 hypothetical protein [Rouxiella aceris]
MNKLAMILLATGLALSSGVALAEGTDAGSNNGNANESGGAGSIQKIAPNSVDNSKINTSDTNTATSKHHKTTKMHKKTSKNTDHKIAICKDGRCPNQTPGSKQSAETGN